MSDANFNKWKVAELKEALEALGLPTKGKKVELILRLQQAQDAGVSMENLVGNNAEEMRRETSVDSGLPRQASSCEGGSAVNVAMDSAAMVELLRREKEVAERELDLMRRELSLMREMQRVSLSTPVQGIALEAAAGERNRTRIKDIADMLGSFDGSSETYERWEKQLRWLKAEYNLAERDAKALVCQKLTGKAAEWFHSKSDYLQMQLEDLIWEIKRMFHYEQGKAERRTRFEERVWRRGESFKEYFHEKTILANRVPIEEEEMVENLIRGIPDPELRDQARMHRFESKASLLRAFELIQWRCKRNVPEITTREIGKPNNNSSEEGNKDTASKWCRSCGSQYHSWPECPTKDQGRKCFECRGYGHVASECPKKTMAVSTTAIATKDSRAVSESSGDKYLKEVVIDGQKLNALIDTGSDLSLVSASKYVELGAPRMRRNSVQFRGIGTDNSHTLGEFETEIVVDESINSILIRVIPDSLMRHDLLIGADFLRKMEIKIEGNTIRMVKIDALPESSDVPEIFSINVCETDAMVKTPVKTRDVNVKMSIVLKDEEPIYQRTGGLSPSEKELVHVQVDARLRGEIIRPSLSEFASPVVLVKKKCCFLEKRVEFLRQIIEKGQVRSFERKTDAVKRFLKAKTTNNKQVQSFLGLAGYFRKFICNYSIVERPLRDLLRANAVFCFGADEECAFERLKAVLADKTVLRLYVSRADTELYADASKYGYGAILLQRDKVDGALHPDYCYLEVAQKCLSFTSGEENRDEVRRRTKKRSRKCGLKTVDHMKPWVENVSEEESDGVSDESCDT